MSDPIPKEDVLGSMNLLTSYEKGEITKYKDVYYLGLNAEKVSPPDGNCSGFDDLLGFYLVVLHDHINYRYEVISSINKGNFSEVVFSYDHKYQRNVAIKISKSTEQNLLIFYEETHKLHVLNEYFDAEDTIEMYDYFFFRGHPCIVFEVLLNSLSVELKNRNYEGFPLPVLKEILESVLQGLKNFSKIGLIHCDLKPDNLALVKEDRYKVKILDFGSSVFVNEQHLARLQCQTHCSPEMMLGVKFGLPSDMWSLGCLAIKLFTGRSPFRENSDDKQTGNMTNGTGAPSKNLLSTSKLVNAMIKSHRYPKYSWCLGAKKRKPPAKDIKRFPNAVDLAEMLSKSKSPPFIDFVRRCLQWDPDTRMTPDEALDHPWIKNTVLDRS